MKKNVDNYKESYLTKKDNVILDVKDLSFYYPNGFKAVNDVNLQVRQSKVTALIGPSGCGKTTFLRCINRMHDLYPGSRYEGEIIFENKNLLLERDLISLRSKIGMVFQKPTAFHMSIYDNVAYGLKLRGIKKKSEVEERVQRSLEDADLWRQVKDKLNSLGTSLSGGQQQRLVIARALAAEPEILLFDEPTSALDPISTAKIEDLFQNMKYNNLTVVIVTHNMQQAARISDYTAFFHLGMMVEFGTTDNIFVNPQDTRTEEYISGKVS